MFPFHAYWSRNHAPHHCSFQAVVMFNMAKVFHFLVARWPIEEWDFLIIWLVAWFWIVSQVILLPRRSSKPTGGIRVVPSKHSFHSVSPTNQLGGQDWYLELNICGKTCWDVTTLQFNTADAYWLELGLGCWVCVFPPQVFGVSF